MPYSSFMRRTSATTRSIDIVRTLRPCSDGLEQNTHRNGQPREVWIAISRFFACPA